VVEVAIPVLEASRGRAFLLFTSHRALQRAAQLLADRVRFPLLIQGEAPKNDLLERFRSLGDAVLLGTSSFWEGVDVRGEALSCVIIDKLPFASPGEPVLQARIDALRRNGGNPFMDLQVPQAAIALKQGAGRLIRDERDRGVLVLCDPRLLSRPYGRVFLDSMPPMARTREMGEVERFFADR
jgi:ATP-dependent DNA helicase DinG